MFTTKSYEHGFEAGKRDARMGWGAQSSRRWSIEYRNGYSDGYHSVRKELTW